MRKYRSLFDLCMVREGQRNGKTVKITAMSYLRPCDDREQRMEDRLLQTSEYILLRGKKDGGWPGLLREVNIVPLRRIDSQAVIDLRDSVPAEYQEKAFVTDRMQKYCSHACYIHARFGGAHGNEAHTGAV